MSRHVLGLGFSPCPNDTFMFHALVHGFVKVPDVQFEPWLADIEELNQRASGDSPLAVTKLSAFAAIRLAERYAVLSAGAALGHGVGPLVVARNDALAVHGIDGLKGLRVAIPGHNTTAALLLRLLASSDIDPVEMRFDRIMPAVAAGEVDAGLVIHESRFTYPSFGLVLVADLGELWEASTGLPLPLGVIAVDRSVAAPLRDLIAHGIAASVRYARAYPEGTREYVREHASELSDDVCDRHIALYVNDASVELGSTGRLAIEALASRARSLGLADEGPLPFSD